jgi:hypothetical protein
MQLNFPKKDGLGATIINVDCNTHVWTKHWIDKKKFGDHKLGMHDNWRTPNSLKDSNVSPSERQ